MGLDSTVFARRSQDAVECRAEPTRLGWSFTDLASADAHALDARFACSARIADSAADRKMFVEVFLASSDSVTADAISRHFARALHNALATALAAHPVAELVA